MKALIFAGLAGLCLGGCSTASLEAARALSTAGGQAANAADASLTAVDPVVGHYVEREAVLAAITNGRDATPPTQELRDQIKRLQENLARRRQMMRSLASAYEAFGALASYDASARYGAALTELDGAIGAFATGIGRTAPDLSNETARISVLFTWFANARRSQALLRNSPALRARATAIAALLEQEKALYTDLFEDQSLQGRDLTMALWNAGFLSARDLFVDQRLAPGFALVEEGEAFTNANPNARVVVLALADMRAQAELQRFRDQLDANIEALEKLAAEHEKFEKTREVSLEEVMAQIARLRQLAEGGD
jgi:cell division septum initiation protein DivIVA